MSQRQSNGKYQDSEVKRLVSGLKIIEGFNFFISSQFTISPVLSLT